jgi:aspartate/methionine/tyrosine aminotransferase
MPQLSQYVSALRPSVFATLTEKMKALSQPPIPLHLGDTFALPPASARWENLDLSSSGNYRYSHPFGLPTLLSELAHKLVRQNGISATSDWLQVTCGATQALHCALQALVEPGQSVLLMAPYWPLFGGMVRCLGAHAVEVECTPRLLRKEASLAEILRQAYTPNVKAVYFSNPNNPDGYVYSPDELQQLADFSQQHDLWVFSDECYEHYLYEGARHTSVATLPGMAERTVSVYSFSKSFAMAGHRLGYAVAVPSLMNSIRRLANHTVYNVSPSIQKAGLETLLQADSFCQEWAPVYSRQRLRMAQAVQAPLPAGGAYFFPEFASPEAAWDFLERALQAGVALAPGAAFGEQYAHCLRICFTCVDEPTLERACQILAALA